MAGVRKGTHEDAALPLRGVYGPARHAGRSSSPMSQNTPAISPRPSRNSDPNPCSSGPCWPQPPQDCGIHITGTPSTCLKYSDGPEAPIFGMMFGGRPAVCCIARATSRTQGVVGGGSRGWEDLAFGHVHDLHHAEAMRAQCWDDGLGLHVRGGRICTRVRALPATAFTGPSG